MELFVFYHCFINQVHSEVEVLTMSLQAFTTQYCCFLPFPQVYVCCLLSKEYVKTSAMNLYFGVFEFPKLINVVIAVYLKWFVSIMDFTSNLVFSQLQRLAVFKHHALFTFHWYSIVFLD